MAILAIGLTLCLLAGLYYVEQRFKGMQRDDEQNKTLQRKSG
jgi:hypothetical protein